MPQRGSQASSTAGVQDSRIYRGSRKPRLNLDSLSVQQSGSALGRPELRRDILSYFDRQSLVQRVATLEQINVLIQRERPQLVAKQDEEMLLDLANLDRALLLQLLYIVRR